MADKKISELTSASALAGTEVLPIVQSGETKKLALNAITTLGTIATGTWQGTQIANAYIATLTTAGKVANSATTATNANTVSAIVARDASGNFSAGTITATLTGNASTVTTNANLTGDVTSVGNATTIASGVVTSAMIADGAIVNGDINASAAIVDTKLATISTAGKVSNSATTATNANTASTIVARDASGNFTAGTVTAALTGNASTAAALQTARNINGVAFDGTADITVTAAAGTLTGSTLASGVTASSLTSVGTLSSLGVSGTTSLNGVAYTWPASAGTNSYVLSTNGSGTLSWIALVGTTSFTLTAGTYLTGGTFNGSSAVTFAVDATSANTASKIVARDASGNFSAGAVTASSIVVSGTTSLNGVAYTWPATVGTNGQLLATNGAGTLAWVNGGGGGGGGTTTFSLTAGTYLTGGTFDGSTAVTFAVDGTSANTASKVVARDASGNFAASVITGTGFQLNTTTAATATLGRFRWEADSGTAQIRLLGGNVDLDVGEDSVVRVLNDTGTAMTLGQVVYITGAAGQRPTVALANAVSEATSTNVIGLVAEGIANNQEGFVYTGGIVKGLNTFAFNEGDLLYLSAATAGALTNVRPTQPNHGVRIGYVVRKNSGDGHVYLAVNNGYEFDELHDVLITTPAANNMIRRNAGNTLWVNIAGPAGDVVGTTDSQTLTNKTISGASNTLSNIGNASLTNSSVTVNGTSIALGASGTVTAAAGTLTGTTLAAGVTASSLTSTGTLVNLTVTNPITGSVTGSSGSATGNAGTATALQTARAINGVNFDGTAAITVAAAAGTLTGATLASNVLASSLTSVGTLAGLTVTAPIAGSVTGSSASTTGNAATATALQTARAINGTNFDGTAAITVTAAASTLTGTTLASGVTGSSLTSVGSLSALTVAGTTTIQQALEKATISATAATGVIAYDALTQAVLYYTSNATANWTTNIRGNSGTTLNSTLAVGQSITVAFMVTTGATAYYPTAHQIDGVSVTPKWQGGTAPTSGNINSIDTYTYTIIKTAATPTYVMLAAQTQFK